jgi:hypothetical protein
LTALPAHRSLILPSCGTRHGGRGRWPPSDTLSLTNLFRPKIGHPVPMTTVGWIIMIVSNAFVWGLTGWCFYRVLTLPPEE